jgi:DNA polymerase elongation subunit (family B)
MKFYTYFLKRGSAVYERYIEDGVRKERTVELEPCLFVKSSIPTEFKSLYGQYLKPCSIADHAAYLEKKKQFQNGGYECFGYEPVEYAYIMQEYGLECPYNSNDILLFSIDIETEVPDNGFPTPEEAECPINVLTIHHSINNKFYVFTYKDFEVTDDVDIAPERIVSKVYADERAMLLGFLKFWNDERPDVVTGWNTTGFDLKYLYFRLKRLQVMFGRRHGEDALSFAGKTQINKWDEVVLKGVSHLDFLQVMKKFNTGERVWSLDAVATDFLGVAKITNPYNNFKDFYTKDWNRFVTYNIRDVELVARLIQKTKQMELVYSLSYLVGCNYEDSFGTLKPWEIYIQNVLMQKGVFLSIDEKSPGEEGGIMGGYVKDPIPGKYEWLVSFDQNSLYPSIIRTWNIGPETIVENVPVELAAYHNRIYTEIPKELPPLLKKHNLAMTANGQFFRRDKKGILAELCGHVYDQRVETKNAMKALKKANYEKGIKNDPQIEVLDHKQYALKIMLNSLYGALANRFFSFFDFRCAEGITSTGQYIIKRIGENVGKEIDKVSGVNNSLTYTDTDSVFLCLKAAISKLTQCDNFKYSNELIDSIDKFAEGFIAPLIDKENAAIGEELNAPFNVLKMKREKICESGFWVTKKRYAVKVWDNEGLRLKEPKYAITGLEIKRSNTPKFAQDKLLELVKVLLGDNANNAPKVLEDFRKEYLKGNILEIGLPVGVSSMVSVKDYVKAAKKPVIPQHVRGALVYNELVRLKGLEGTYRQITNGTKVFRYLLKPNPISKLFAENAHELDPRLGNARVDVICIPQTLENNGILEFFEDFVDRDKMFGLALGEAGQRMVEACGIHAAASNSLDSFF